MASSSSKRNSSERDEAFHGKFKKFLKKELVPETKMNFSKESIELLPDVKMNFSKGAIELLADVVEELVRRIFQKVALDKYALDVEYMDQHRYAIAKRSLKAIIPDYEVLFGDLKAGIKEHDIFEFGHIFKISDQYRRIVKGSRLFDGDSIETASFIAIEVIESWILLAVDEFEVSLVNVKTLMNALRSKNNKKNSIVELINTIVEDDGSNDYNGYR
jgi:hypothetical protein